MKPEILPRRLVFLLLSFRDTEGSVLVGDHCRTLVFSSEKWRLRSIVMREPHTIILVLRVNRLVVRGNVDIVIRELIAAEILQSEYEQTSIPTHEHELTDLEQVRNPPAGQVHMCSGRILRLNSKLAPFCTLQIAF